MPTVAATWKGERVYLSTQTDLNWRTLLTLSFTPTPLSTRAAASVYALALKDDQLFDVRMEVHA